MPDEFAYDAVAVRDDFILDECGDVADATSCSRQRNDAVENILGDSEQARPRGLDSPDRDSLRGVADPSVFDDADIEFDNVAVLDATATTDPVDHLLVHRGRR